MALLFLASVWALGSISGHNRERRDETPAAYREAAQTYAQRACAGRQPAAVFECVYGYADTARESAHDEQDLSAQQMAALAALGSAMIGAFTFLLTFVGLWFIKRTLDANLDAVRLVEAGTNVALESSKIATEALYGVERPIIIVRMPSNKERMQLVGPPPNHRPTATFAMINVGKQIGTVKVVSGRMLLRDSPDDFPPFDMLSSTAENWCLGNAVGETIIPVDHDPMEVTLIRSKPFTEQDIAAIRNRSKVCFLVVCLVYSDPLYKLRQALSMFAYSPPGKLKQTGTFIQVAAEDSRMEKHEKTDKEASLKYAAGQLKVLWSSLGVEANGEDGDIGT